MSDDDIVARLRNFLDPDCCHLRDRAADEIERLRSLCGDLKRARDETSKNADFLRETMRAEIERLREALRKIEKEHPCVCEISYAMQCIARAALTPEKKYD